MKKLLCIIVILLTGCSTLQVGDVKYDTTMATTDTLTITKPDGTKITLKGKTTVDPAMLGQILSGAAK
jgi:hypothetical protein